MAVVLGIVAPVFLIIALGYGAAKRVFVDQAGFKGLNTFAFSLASPALLFLGGTTGAVGGGRAALAFFVGRLWSTPARCWRRGSLPAVPWARRGCWRWTPPSATR
jgi:predicted permease